MRISFFLSFIVVFNVSANIYSQTVKLDLQVENITVRELLKLIESKSQFRFFYSDDVRNLNRKITLSTKECSIEHILNQILSDGTVSYKVLDNNIVVITPFVGLQNHTVSGIVSDVTTGESLPGVSIIVEGTSAGAITDVSGNYSIALPSDTATLIFSFVGYIPEKIKFTGQAKVDVKLVPDVQKLNDVVVVGYATQKKLTLTGAVSAIKGEDMVRTKNENTINMLTGKVPGVRITQNSSAPGAYDASIDIRGMGAPLFVIDGVPRDKDYFSRMSAEEIESVSVLKDGSAAVYGLHGGNGVILVTTKSGKAQNGKVDVSINSSYSMQSFLYVPESVNAVDYMTLRNEQNAQDFGKNYLTQANPIFTQADIQPYIDGTKKSYNWVDAVFKKVTPQYQHDLSVNGGNEKLRYFFNLGYSKQMGSYKSDDYKSDRWNLRTNVDAQITKRLSAKVSLGGFIVNTTQPNGTGWTTYKLAWLARPDASFYANDNPAYPNGDSNVLNEGANMIVQTNSDDVGYNKNQDRRFNGTLTLKYDIPGIQGLSAKGMYDYSLALPDYTTYQKAYTLYRFEPNTETYSPIPHNTPSNVTRGITFNYNTDMQLGLYYDHSFGKHNFNSFLVYEEGYYSTDNFNAYRQLLINSEYLFAGEEDKQKAWEGTLQDNASRSMIGQLAYDYASKYILDFKFRYDGSSKFPDGSRYGFFPSISAGWRLSEEGFLKDNIPLINNLKIRASYGEMGDDASANNYPPTPGFQLNSNEVGWYYNGVFTGGVSPSTIPNPNLTWYKLKTYNLGLDFSILKNKLSGTFDVYKRDRSGLLATSSAVVPGTVGASLPQENLNSDRNFGYEISLEHRNRIRNVNYFVSGQISATKSMSVTTLETPAGNSYDHWRNRTSGRYNNIWWGQESGGEFTSYDQIRTFSQTPQPQSALPGDWYIQDWNGDGVIDGNDDHPIASKGLPVFNYGFSLGGSWKGFDVALDFQGAYGVYVQYAEVLTEALPFGGQNTLTWFMDRWHPVDPNADLFNPNTQWVSGYYPVTGHDGRRTGSNGVQNASYMRLKTAELGYTLPVRWLQKAGVKSLRVYLSGYNLLTFTGLKYTDPERPTAGDSNNPVQFYNYPNNRTITVGASLKF